LQQYILTSAVAFYPVRTVGEFKAHITFVNMFLVPVYKTLHGAPQVVSSGTVQAAVPFSD